MADIEFVVGGVVVAVDFFCVFVVAVDSKNLPLKFGQNQVVVVVVDFVVLLLLILIPNT